MDHWFDEFTKRLALGNFSRRTLLSGALKTGVAATGTALLGSGALPRVAFADNGQGPSTGKNEDKAKGVSCSVSQNGPFQRVFHAIVTDRDGQLVLDETFTTDVTPLNQGARTLASSLTISLQGATVFQESLTGTFTGMVADKFALSSFTLTLRYGQGFQGVKAATFTSDGTTIQGTVDGRAIVSFPVNAPPGSFTFADGGPAPVLNVAGDVRGAINQITNKTKNDVSECFAAFDPGDCQDCQDQCLVAFPSGALECAAGSVGTCIFTFGIGCVVGVVTCDVNYGNCQDKCFNPGSPCCTVGCPNGYCCPTGTKCAITPPNVPGITPGLNTCCAPSESFTAGFCPFDNPNCGGICCPPGEGTSCGGICCGAPCCKEVCCFGGTCTTTEGICCPTVNGASVVSCKGTCCSDPADVCSTGGICCPPLPGGPNPPISCNGTCCPDANDICVGKGCCPAGAPVCNDGTCCPQGQGTCLNGTCCFTPSHVCGNTCCAPFAACCNNVCCQGSTDICVSGTCCPAAQACGNVCCASGQFCQNGTCAACPSGTVATICQNFGSGPATTCCPPGVACCAGQCCPSGQICCAPSGPGSFGCYNQTICIR